MYLQGKNEYSYEWFSQQQPIYDKIDSDAAFTIKLMVTKRYTMFTRQIYNGLDLIGDIGGLKDGLLAISSLLIQIQLLFTDNPWMNFLLGSLFKVEQQRKQSNLSWFDDDQQVLHLHSPPYSHLALDFLKGYRIQGQ